MRILVISPEPGSGRAALTWALALDLAARDLPVTVASGALPANLPDTCRVAINSAACIGCMRCQMTCQVGAVELGGPGNAFVGKTYQIDPAICTRCGDCLPQCPSQSIAWHVSQAADGEAPVAVLEGPAGITTRLSSLLYMVDHVVVIARRTDTACNRLPELLALLVKQDAKTVLVLNASGDAPALAQRVKDIAAELNVPVIGDITPASGLDIPEALTDWLLASPIPD